MVTLKRCGQRRHSAARKSHRTPISDTEILNRARSVSVEACLETCRAEFVASDLAVEPGAAFTAICSALTSTQPHEGFWKLYCCDSSKCGVHLDRGGRLGQSRRWPGEGASLVVGADSVQPTSTCLSTSAESKHTTLQGREILLMMRSHGFYDIYDPGAPAISCGEPSSFVLPAQPSPLSSSSIPSLPALTSRESPAPATSDLPDSATITVSSGASSSYAPAAAAQNTPSSLGGLSQGVRAAIGICCAVAMVVLLAAFCLTGRRRRNNRGYLKSPPPPRRHHPRAEPRPQGGSPSPLLTPPPSSSAKTMPVTPPPPRLSDRRYLASMTLGLDLARLGHTGSPAATAFPRAPICSPAGKKLAPRPEKPAATSPSGNSPLSDLAQRGPPLAGAPCRSPNGQDSTTGASSATAEDKNPRSLDPTCLPGTPPSPPSRPKRPHDSLLEVGTVRPASKSLNWALPTPPRSVRHPRAPASPPLPVSPLSTTGSTSLPATSSQATPHLRHSGIVAGPKHEEDPPVSEGTRSGPLIGSSDFIESHARKKRGTSVSWGSWVGTGAAGRSRAAERRPRGTGDKRGTGGAAVPLQELNLEALGGSY